jgi:hypothetical protein
VGKIRVPIAIANELRAKRDAFSKRVVAAIGKVDRPNWGPEVEVSQKDVDFLTEIGSNLRKDPATPAKLLSAANKLIAIIRELSRETDDSGGERLPVGHKFTQRLGKAWGELSLNAVDPVTAGSAEGETSTIAMQEGTARTLDEVMTNIVASNPAAQAITDIVQQRRAALVRLGTLVEIFRVERPGIASVLELIIEDVKAM